MSIPTNFFENLENLEPQCPGCEVKIDYGITTEYDDNIETHKCKTCGHKF